MIPVIERAGAAASLLVFFNTAAMAATNTLASVLDDAGDWSSGGSFSNLSAVAQPGGTIVSSGGTYLQLCRVH